jgi:ketosteroid isomerase-like protein
MLNRITKTTYAATAAATTSPAKPPKPEEIPMTSTDINTSSTANAATVTDIYAAFGRGDVPAILDTLADDVAWEQWPDNFAQRAQVPYLLARHGPAEVAEFFTVLSGMTVLDFAVLDVIGADRQVVADVRASFALPDGGRFADEELHLWTFDDAGKVIRFRHYCDTAKHIAANRGEDTTAN